MYLEYKEFANQVMHEFFERLEQVISDYSNGQFKIYAQLSGIESVLADIEVELLQIKKIIKVINDTN